MLVQQAPLLFRFVGVLTSHRLFASGLHVAQRMLPHTTHTRILEPLFLVARHVAQLMFGFHCEMVFLLKVQSDS